MSDQQKIEKIKVAVGQNAENGKIYTEDVTVLQTFEHGGRLWAVHPEIAAQAWEQYPTLHVTDIITGRRLPIQHTYAYLVIASARSVIDENADHLDYSSFPTLNHIEYVPSQH